MIFVSSPSDFNELQVDREMNEDTNLGSGEIHKRMQTARFEGLKLESPLQAVIYLILGSDCGAQNMHLYILVKYHRSIDYQLRQMMDCPQLSI